jgi:S1/P1 Nuclease
MYGQRLALFALLILQPLPALAWGPEGHEIIAQIAEDHLTPEARQIVWAMLDGASLASVSNWADDIRPSRPETARWHYVNFAEGAKDYVPARDCADIPGQGDCVIAAIGRAVADLTRDDASQVDALKFLVHFVGDVHQPFHAVATERGGNGIHVTFFGNRTNLHAVWDSGFIQHSRRTSEEYAKYLETTWITGKDVTVLAQGTPVDWAFASRDIGEAALVPQGSPLEQDYYVKYAPVVDGQLALAGLRLAKLLNENLR